MSFLLGLWNILRYVLLSIFLAMCVCAFEVYYAGVYSIFHWQCSLDFVRSVFDFVCSDVGLTSFVVFDLVCSVGLTSFVVCV